MAGGITASEARSAAYAARARGDRDAALTHFRALAALRPNDAAALTEVGAEFRALGRLEEAAASYGEALAADPGYAAARRGLGATARLRGDRAGALAQFRALADAAPGDPAPLVEVASDLRALGRPDEAEAAYAAALALDAGSVAALRGLAALARGRGDDATALARFEALAALRPDDAAALAEVAASLRACARPAEAEAAYRRALDADPAFVPALRGEAALARARGDHEGALARFRTLAALKPDDGAALIDIAIESRALGRPDEAVAAYEGALALDPRSPPALRGLCATSRLRGDVEACLAHRRTLAALRPDDVAVLTELAADLRDCGRFEEAVVTYDRVLALEPLHPGAWRGKAGIARQRGDRETALSLTRLVTALRPDDLALGSDMAADLRELGRPAEAETLARDLVGTHPSSARALLGLVPYSRSEAEIAGLLARAVDLAPSDPGVLLASALGHSEIWSIEEAERQFEAVLAGDAANIPALIGQAQLAAKRGRRSLARHLLRQAAALPTFSPAALRALAQHLADDGAFDEADDCLRTVLARQPQDLATLLQRANLRRQQGDFERALTAFAEAAAIYPDHPAPPLGEAKTAFLLGRVEQAVDSLARLLGRQPRHAGGLQLLAEWALYCDDVGAAALLYGAAAESHPADGGARLGIAKCLARLGHAGEALALLDVAEAAGRARPQVLLARIEIERSTGLLRRACESADRAAGLFPDHVSIGIARAQAHLAAGDLDSADALSADAMECTLPEGARLHYHRGHLALRRWNAEAAVEGLRRSLDCGRAEHVTHFRLAKAALLLADLDLMEHHLGEGVRFSTSNRALQGLQQEVSQTQFGKLLEQAKGQPALVATLRATSGADDETRLDRLLDAVRESPEVTYPAVALFAHLRRNGLLRSLDEARASSGPDPIPRHLVQFWDADDPPEEIRALGETWTRANPGLRYTRFSEATARAALAAGHDRRVLAAFDRSPEPAMKADIFRLAYLFEHGGYYADADDGCTAAIETLNPGGVDLLVYQEEEVGSIANNFLAAAPRHPVLGRALEGAVSASEGFGTEMVWFSTGPGLLTRAFAAAAHDREALSALLGRTLVLDHHELLRAVVPHCTASYKFTSRHWSRTAFGARDLGFARRVRGLYALAGIGRTAIDADPPPKDGPPETGSSGSQGHFWSAPA